MVYRKKIYRRKRVYRKRPYRKSRKSMKKSSINKVYYFTRWSDFGTSTVASSLTPGYFGFNFSLSDLPNYTEFTSLYDYYKIKAVKVVFLPQMTENVSLGSVNNPYSYARFQTAIDYSDSNPPTTLDELREYKSYKFTPLLKPHTRYIPSPKFLDSSGFQLTNWMATSSPNVNYNGLKVCIEPIGSTGTLNMYYSMSVKMYLAFKNVK